MCFGSLDGNHIQPPKKKGSHYTNYKLGNSIVLLALVDAHLNFIYIDVGTNGRISDGGVFAKSDLNKALKQNVLNVPKSALLPLTETRCPFMMVGDDAFPLTTRLMKPYPSTSLAKEKRIFNYRLSRCRRTVENAFGVLSSRFGIFQKPIKTFVENAISITTTCCYLHNLLRQRSRSYVTADLIDTECHIDTTIRMGQYRNNKNCFRKLKKATGRPSNDALAVRDTLKRYFSGVGSVPWQESMLSK